MLLCIFIVLMNFFFRFFLNGNMIFLFILNIQRFCFCVDGNRLPLMPRSLLFHLIFIFVTVRTFFFRFCFRGYHYAHTLCNVRVTSIIFSYSVLCVNSTKMFFSPVRLQKHKNLIINMHV